MYKSEWEEIDNIIYKGKLHEQCHQRTVKMVQQLHAYAEQLRIDLAETRGIA